jgi:hypothetical protein
VDALARVLTKVKDAALGGPAEAKAIGLYLKSDRTPHFSPGYSVFKEHLILESLADPGLRAAFAAGAPLPAGYGARMDERVVEYPWVFTRLPHEGVVLDAGSTFNKERLINSDLLKNRSIIIYTLETDRFILNPKVSYLFGDLRDIILRDASVQSVVCISTLEHVGFTYEYKQFSRRNPWPHAKPDSYLDAIAEFRRVLSPKGTLLLTVPYGRYEDHAWLQQFDAERIAKVKERFSGVVKSETYYRYADGGWRVATADECADLGYFNIHETGRFEEDGLAAARAVCCVELEKP